MPSEIESFFANPGERMGNRWSQQEENYVFARFSHGDSLRDIANRIGRGQQSVSVRLQSILGISSDVSPITLRNIAEANGYPIHQATFMGDGSNRRRSPNPIAPVAQDLLPGGRAPTQEARQFTASQWARVPIPAFSRFDAPPSSTPERSRTATEVNTARSLTIEDIRRAGTQLDQSMTVRPSPRLIEEVMFSAPAMPMEVGRIDRFSIREDLASRPYRPATPQRPGPAAASAPPASVAAASPPVRQPFSKHQQRALIATLRELRGQGSQAALDAVARAIATQTPGFDIEAFKTSCRELVPA